jgi:hypothetical protein
MSGILGILMGVGGAVGVISGFASHANAAGAAGLTLQNDAVSLMSGASNGTWVTPATAGVAAQWEVYATVTAGSIDSGTTGSWLSLGTSRAWSKTSVGTATLTFQWRQAGVLRATQTGVNITVT